MTDSPSASQIDEAAELLEELLGSVVEALQLDADVTVEYRDGTLLGRVEGDDLGLFIGRHGRTIEAVQHLAQRIVLKGDSEGLRVLVDAGDYRASRAEALRAEAEEAVEDALRTGGPIELSPMPALERRVVHEHLRDREGIRTYSEGAEPDRYLVVAPDQ
jgi:spoIIIJ-associated protein